MYNVQGTIVSALSGMIYLQKKCGDKCYYYPHLIDKKTDTKAKQCTEDHIVSKLKTDIWIQIFCLQSPFA